MATSYETKIHTSNIDTVPQYERPQVAGILKEPIVQQIGQNSLVINYNWEAPGDKHTYLHLLLRKSPEDSFGVAHANIDSGDIKGQGDLLWNFIGSQLQTMSNRGKFTIHHEVDTNDYSRRLPEADPRYVQMAENKYLGVYTPQSQESVVKTYPSERV